MTTVQVQPFMYNKLLCINAYVNNNESVSNKERDKEKKKKSNSN